ncbi:MAG: glycosyltransferase [Lachnospiraceae bacterium]|nr:glycosyltransferase [Lachnospiraceae bacterium]
MKNKKILLLNSIAGTGSTGRILTGLAAMLQEEGNESLICYGRKSFQGGALSYRIGNDPGVYLHGALSRLTDRHGLYSSHATKKLVRRIREYAPDLIHLHNVHGYYLNIPILFRFLREYGRPVLWTLHDCWSFTGHCTHYEYVKCTRWMKQCHDCPQLREYPRSFFADASASNYRLKKNLFTGIEKLQLVTPSEWLKKQVSRSFLKDYPATVIPTGIDLDQFRPTASDLRERYGLQGKTVLLGVANPWRERKGLDDFISLAERLPEGYAIVMIGLKKKQLARIPSKIIGMEKTDSVSEMAMWYTLADQYVNLTREDTFPTTNLEALACGTPVITYRAGGSPESVTHSTGEVLEVDDLDAVLSSITRFGRKGQDLSGECLSRAKEYDRNLRFREYMAKYEEILHSV